MIIELQFASLFMAMSYGVIYVDVNDDAPHCIRANNVNCRLNVWIAEVKHVTSMVYFTNRWQINRSTDEWISNVIHWPTKTAKNSRQAHEQCIHTNAFHSRAFQPIECDWNGLSIRPRKSSIYLFVLLFLLVLLLRAATCWLYRFNMHRVLSSAWYLSILWLIRETAQRRGHAANPISCLTTFRSARPSL